MNITATQVRERPILFNGEMVRAILAGRKTMTRRVVKPQPTGESRSLEEWARALASHCGGERSDEEIAAKVAQLRGHVFPFSGQSGGSVHSPRCPYGQPGDRLWVRETFCPVDDREYGGEKWIDYRATPRYDAAHPAGWDNAPKDAEALKWRPSIHMPRWASRLTLEITDVRVERLPAISDADALDEGIPSDSEPVVLGGDVDIDGNWWAGAPRQHFRKLWDRLNAPRGFGWDANPWVWAISFRRLP